MKIRFQLDGEELASMEVNELPKSAIQFTHVRIAGKDYEIGARTFDLDAYEATVELRENQ